MAVCLTTNINVFLRLVYWFSSPVHSMRTIGLCTHSGFFFHTLSQFGNDSYPLIKDDICKHMIATEPSVTNCPGKIPSVLSPLSDTANAKKPENS
ncbi:hypothetical protein Droror1_Dr00018246 [Drosera rotundifolia]